MTMRHEPRAEPLARAPTRRRTSRLLRLLATALAFALPAAPAGANEPCGLGARGDVPPARIAALAKGFNLVGWTDRAERRRPPQEALATLRRRGFTHVRLPVDGTLLMPGATRPADIDDRLLELDAALAHMLEQGFAVSLDMHPSAPFIARHRADPEGAFAALSALWRQLADRYRRSPPDKVFFELLNEPGPDVAVWRDQLTRLLAELRPRLPDHTFIVGTADYQQIHRLLETMPVADRNVVYAVHFYEPMSFTHQGADWNPGDPVAQLARVPYPLTLAPAVSAQIARLERGGHLASAALLERDARAAWLPKRIGRAMADVATWSRRHDRPVIVNEFGVLKRKAMAADRARWLSEVRAAAEQACLGWTHWEFDESFGFLTRTPAGFELDEKILDALLPQRGR